MNSLDEVGLGLALALATGTGLMSLEIIADYLQLLYVVTGGYTPEAVYLSIVQITSIVMYLATITLSELYLLASGLLAVISLGLYLRTIRNIETTLDLLYLRK